jgi:hypothetical protein
MLGAITSALNSAAGIAIVFFADQRRSRPEILR